MPLSLLFGPDALEYRLQDSAAVARSSATASQPTSSASIARALPGVEDASWSSATRARRHRRWPALLDGSHDAFEPAATRATDPAILIYTSGTTGAPKGALMPQSALLGNLSGFELSQNGFPRGRRDDVFWSPADWAWTGGLMDALLPTLYHGRRDRRRRREARRPLRPARRVRTDGAPSRHERVHLPDRAEDDDEGRAASARRASTCGCAA